MSDQVFQGTVILPDRIIENGFVFASEGVVRHVGAGAPPSGERYGGPGMLVLPGAIDAQVHSRSQRGSEDFLGSTASAALGGVTTIVDMPYDEGSLIADAPRFAAKRADGEAQAHVDFALYATVDPEDGARRVDELVACGAIGFKFSTFGTDPRRFPRIPPQVMAECFARIAPHGLIAGVHNEDDEVVRAGLAAMAAAGRTDYAAHGEARSPLSEALATVQIYEVGAATGCAAHVVHCSIGRGYELAAAYRAQGHGATIEACIHYLMLDEEAHVARLKGKAKVNPPIRPRAETEALWRHLAAGNVTVVSTDHVSWTEDRKSHEDMFANASGVPGLEVLVPLLLKGLEERQLSFSHAARLLAHNPAALFRLGGGKGALEVGCDADVVLMRRDPAPYDPAASGVNAVDWSPYAGMVLPHRPVATFLRGKAVAAEGRLLAEPGSGSFLKPRVANA